MQGSFVGIEIDRRSSMASCSSMMELGYTSETRKTGSATGRLESWSRSNASRRKQTSDKDDPALIERFKAGDHEALETIVDLYSPKLYNVAQRILGDSADTEDRLSQGQEFPGQLPVFNMALSLDRKRGFGKNPAPQKS